MKLHTAMVRVTPSLAHDWLALNTNNRRIRLTVVEEYAADMQAKRWRPNGDTLKFDTAGKLRDGQHRLLACVVSKTPFSTLVVRGVEDAAVISIDNNARRSTADYLYLTGATEKGDAVAFSHTARLLDSYYRHGLGMLFSHGQGPVSRADVLEFVLANQKRLRTATEIGKGLKDIMPATVGGALWFITSQHHSRTAAEYFTGLKTGENLRMDSPMLAVRNRLVHQKAGRVKWTPRETMSLVIRGWNAFFNGKPLIHMSARFTMPQIAGVPVVLVQPEVQALHSGAVKLVEYYQQKTA